jgi:hypothetical protein
MARKHFKAEEIVQHLRTVELEMAQRELEIARKRLKEVLE